MEAIRRRRELREKVIREASNWAQRLAFKAAVNLDRVICGRP
jgi:hypothetical protein